MLNISATFQKRLRRQVYGLRHGLKILRFLLGLLGHVAARFNLQALVFCVANPKTLVHVSANVLMKLRTRKLGSCNIPLPESCEKPWG